jgi:asparagine synthase (glutamine-hydrolysing)
MARGRRPRHVIARSFGPWFPAWLWRLGTRLNGAAAPALSRYSAINPKRASELQVEARAKSRQLDLAFRPSKSAFDMRLRALGQIGDGAYRKGGLAAWGVDDRDPTADRRLVEFCLGTPTDMFMRGGEPRWLARRALADRLPREVLDASARGYQAADWHEGLTAHRGDVAAELRRLEASTAADRALDLPRLEKLVADWPTGGWERIDVREAYRLALLRGISAGHFLRRATGSNA